MIYIYTTGSNKNYPIEMEYKKIDSADIVYDYERVTSYCEDCGNFNQGGGCPPRAPNIEKIIDKKSRCLLVYGILDSCYKSQKVKSSNNYYIHYRSQDIVLSNLLTKLGYRLRNLGEHIVFLNNGFCMGCVKRCNFKGNKDFCRRPERRTFSLEATGVDVEKTLKKHTGIELQWYTGDNYREVEYMVKVIGLFYNDREYLSIVEDELVCQLNQLQSTKYEIDSKEYNNILKKYL